MIFPLNMSFSCKSSLKPIHWTSKLIFQAPENERPGLIFRAGLLYCV